jgi:flagellar biosynthesis/type III secretory pathway protein FliH
MIIKRKHAGQLSPNIGDELLPGMAETLAEPPEEIIEWNEETVGAGLAPERRTEDRRNDRRRGYRRVEDKGLISKAYEEANAIRENAQAQGFHEGLNQAHTAIEELRNTLAQLMNGREEALLSVANEIGSLAVEVAARIIKTEVSCDDALVMALVKDTIQKAGRNSKSILLKLHPDDAPAVKRIIKEDDALPNLNAELIIMDDPSVDQGSCVIETNSGLIDASFSTQLGILRQLFGGQEKPPGDN